MLVKVLKPPEWLRSKDVNDGDAITILAQPTTNPFTSSQKPELILPLVSLREPDKLFMWRLNLTTWRTLFQVYGENGQSWVGKQVKVKKVNLTIEGREIIALYGSPIEVNARLA